MDSTQVDPKPVETAETMETEMAKKEVLPNAGRCGIFNIGNTCYMSTGIQCLSHIPDLVKLLITDEFISMLNRDNVMGSNGLVTEAFSVLLKQLWASTSQYISPHLFKRTFQGYDSQFVGNDQHDSQEFFAKLVDVLHEDLNLILKKPYIESPIYKEYDAKQAEEMWNIFLQRKTSRIVDLLYGMTWNQIRCTECGEMRLKYEPNNVLMLPMPAETYKIPINILVDREEGDVEEKSDSDVKIDEKEKEKSDEKEKEENNEKKDDKATADNDVKAMGDCKETTDDEKTEAVPAASKPRPPKKLARQRVSYLEVQYNFYGLCSELYEAVAAHLDLSVDRFDLVMKTQLEYDSVGFITFSDTVHASAPQRPAEPTVHLRTA